MVVTLGLSVDVSPTEALLDEVRWTAGHVQWLRAKVAELGPLAEDAEAAVADELRYRARDPLVWGLTKSTTGEHGADTYAAAPSIWYVLYTKERDHLVVVCAAALRAGVEERRVRLAESQGELVAQVIRAILADLGLTDAQQALVGEVVPRHLRLLAGGPA